MCATAIHAQTDCTSLITNPSFELGTEGWVHQGMNAQTNTVFSIKSGNTYMERWIGSGGAVGNGKLSQVLYNLPPGNYELTAAAQNIQEGSPTAAQTGVWIFAEGTSFVTLNTSLYKTAVTVRDTYKVAFSVVSGNVTIGFEAKNASGNWIAVDNFRLTRVSEDLSAVLAESIENAESHYGTATGKESQQLADAIASAKAVDAKTDATGEEQATAIVAVENAIDLYLRANASADNPLDMTGRITNPSFETGDLTGWTATNMGPMDNDFFTVMQGTWYVEKWTWRGNSVGDGRISQKLTDIPAGRYRLKVAAQNIQEDTPSQAQSGAWIFAGSNTKDVTIRNNYTLEFVQVADVLEIGFEAKGATGNWISVDNFRLEYISDDITDVKAELSTLIAQGEELEKKRMNAEAQQALTDALTTARTALQEDSGISAAATALEAAIATAIASNEVFDRLADAIDAAKNEIANPQATEKADYRRKPP